MSGKIKIKECQYIHDNDKKSLSVISVNNKTAFTVFCGVCGGTGPNALSPEEAINKWNQRYVVLLSEEEYAKALEKSEEDDGTEKNS